MPKLANARHEAFARHLAKGRSQAEAYRLAGYEDGSGNASTLYTSNKSIQQRTEELKSAAARRAEVSIEYVLTHTKELLSRCMQKEPVMVKDEKGELVPSGEWKFDSSGANKALDLLAKHLGMYNHEKHVKHSGHVTTEQVNLTGLAPEKFEQLRAIVQEAQRTPAKRSD